MNEDLDKQQKKEVMKDIILKLHQGLSLEEAKERFEKEIGNITSTEIAEIEQSLINEGLSPEEIKKFCNVHALLFQSALEKSPSEETSPGHPVYLFRLENREIEKLTAALFSHNVSRYPSTASVILLFGGRAEAAHIPCCSLLIL